MADRLQTLKIALEHLKAGRFEQCADLCRPLLEAAPHDVDARFFLGVCLGSRGDIDGGIAELRQAVAATPEHVDARQELGRMLQARGLALIDRGEPEDAIAAFGEAVAADRNNGAAHANLANALAHEGRFAESLAATTDALRVSPTDLTIHLNQAVALLKSGRLLEGWAANEWRHRKQGREKLPPALMLPQLAHLSGGVAGKTIMIYHEEGFGDTIQFLRYAKLLNDAGARVVLWVPQELLRLAQGHPYIAEVLTGNVNLPKFDFHCPIISLPYVFGTGLDSVPADSPYIAADSGLVRDWGKILPPGRRVGLCWSGDPRPYDPAAMALDRRRSVPAAALAPLIDIANVTVVSLQMGAARSQTPAGVADHMSGVRDFADTAAMIANLDLVISVDTAVAHLAGAMGKPVFLLDRYDNCWRWLHGRDDSPWYPTMRIFRQGRMGDWAPVVTAAAAALEDLASHG